MDAELARHIGNGLNNLSAALLEHQRASARDRGIMLQKIDDLDAKFDEKFDRLGERIVDVCDKGGQEHRKLFTRMDALERRVEIQEATRIGRAQATKFFADASTWALAHGWKAAIVVYVGWQSIAPMIMEAVMQ